MADATAIEVHVIDLDKSGALLAGGVPLPVSGLPLHLAHNIPIPRTTTDIFVFAHGWRNTRKRGLAAATRLYDLISREYAAGKGRYQALDTFRPVFIAMRWPSMSPPIPFGYRRIRDRAHRMTTHGQASLVLAHLLGYLHQQRTPPTRGPGRLRTADGQYLHCLGHSFGARLVGEAIMLAANPPTPPKIGWPWRKHQPFGVDTFVALQMAAPPNIFEEHFAPLTGHAPITGHAPLHGPVVLTFSRGDRANRLWHRLPEAVPGIGATGLPNSSGATIRLKQVIEPYTAADFLSRVVSVDATHRFRRGRWLRPEGAHSDYLYPETAHLVLSLAALAR